ncbi:MAG: mechanosensitive ion channel [Novosphingobium sp.]|nr:mechanosensitive ion channel [Novosphingobium sp.]
MLHKGDFVNYAELLQEQINAMIKGLVQALPSLALALVALFITWIAARFAVRLTGRVTRDSNMRESLKQLVETLARLGIWIAGILIAMTIAMPNLNPAGLVAGLGIGALAIGFAFQDIFENFLAGVLIMVREKMRIGDAIECEGILGKVEKITLRETHIRQFSNELTIVPNSLLFKNPVKILTDEDVRRNEIVIGVSYDTDLDRAQEVIRDAVEGVEAVDKERPVAIFAQEFNSSSVDFLVLWWSNTTQQDLRETKSEVIHAIKQSLDTSGIEIPFPYITHTFKESVPLGRAEDNTG